ncbi:hypothetical protein [Ramlibacter sp.]|uniref:hypothetical protein n=1 Tax=Ramlibacter sp. TaxID=1917967 RepID=UPI002D4D61EB|nr:hypothetical protein [Ramlibacter sp.]HYD77917.1 hypothetical protein [Ramlibacter sp.]
MAADSRRPRPPAPATFVAGTRATAPMALEESGESAWQLFQDLQRMHGMPVTPPAAGAREPAPGPGLGGFEPTQPMHAAAPAATPSPTQRQRPPVDLEIVMQLVRRNNRACPLPEPWAAFHTVLPPRLAGGQRIPAPAPIDGPAWAASSAMQKRLRLRDQIEWAQRQGALQAVFEFLSGLGEGEWEHFG